MAKTPDNDSFAPIHEAGTNAPNFDLDTNAIIERLTKWQALCSFTVTGAEALYADMGHFGKRAIRLAWLAMVMPALLLNYLGQGALLLAHPEKLENPFFLLYPDWALLPMVALATIATIIASQAVISGAFSLTQQAMQLGLLPRMEIRRTSETEIGQIYIPRINWLLLAAVLYIVFAFKSSTALASAYGVAVTGTFNSILASP